jgi:hypothetical protein
VVVRVAFGGKNVIEYYPTYMSFLQTAPCVTFFFRNLVN